MIIIAPALFIAIFNNDINIRNRINYLNYCVDVVSVIIGIFLIIKFDELKILYYFILPLIILELIVIPIYNKHKKQRNIVKSYCGADGVICYIDSAGELIFAMLIFLQTNVYRLSNSYLNFLFQMKGIRNDKTGEYIVNIEPFRLLLDYLVLIIFLHAIIKISFCINKK